MDKKKTTNKKRFTSRKIAREMARRNMRRSGLTKINRIPKDAKLKKTPFQVYWKDYVFPRGVLR